MRTTASLGARDGRSAMAVLLAAIAAGLVGVLLASGPAGAHDHRIPNTVLKKGARELQAGTLVKESYWVYPADGGLCANESTIYRTRFPETDTVRAGSKLRMRSFKAQRPDSFEVAAYGAVGEDGTPVGEGRLLRRSLDRVIRDGKTVAWDVVFSVKSPGRDYYLVTEGHWKDWEGCGGDQFAYWSFHVKTRAA